MLYNNQRPINPSPQLFANVCAGSQRMTEHNQLVPASCWQRFVIFQRTVETVAALFPNALSLSSFPSQ